MSFIGKILGSDAAISKTIDTVSNGLDKLIYTDEEKADAAASDRSEARKMVIGWMQTTQGQNLARRVLALAITATWLLQYILAQTASIISIWTSESERWLSMAAMMQNGAESMNTAVMLILAFYFAAPHMGDIVSSLLSKMGKDGVITKG